MVILGEWELLMSEVPLYPACQRTNIEATRVRRETERQTPRRKEKSQVYLDDKHDSCTDRTILEGS